MTPERARAMYAREMAKHGEPVTITRGSQSTTGIGRIVTESSGTLTDSVQQKRLQAVVLADGLGFEPAEADAVTMAGRAFRIADGGSFIRRVAGVTVAYDLILAG